MAGGMATMLLCTLLFSCNNEDFLESGNPEKACDNICFGISSDKNVQTRGYAGSDDEGYTANRFVLRSDDSADTLCVRTLVSDGINVSGFEDEQALTRGVPVGKDIFYDQFHVLAYWSKNSTPVDQFYMNTNASNVAASVGTGAIWSTEQIYYWPGADHSFQFYAWAPTDASGLGTPTTPETKTLAYTVPEVAADQKDIVVATTNEIPGDNNKAVPLTFKHICTAVRFAVGSQMQPGSIKSVALKGVKNTGTYDMATGTWALAETTKDFSQDDLNKSMTGNETDGTEITSPEGTFMMLPQTLPAGATVEVVFTNASGVDRTLAASIGNTVWTMGTTVTYKLSITPEYEMNIEVPTEAQDAHYITFPITVNVKDYDGAWTLTSNLSNDVFFTQTKTDLQEQGYWIDDDKGANTISSTGSGSFTYHVYVTENIGDAARDLQFQITPTVNGATPITATVQQLCPSWNAQGVGYERIEENNGGSYPFGFKWDRKVVYSYEGFFAFLFKWAADSYKNENTQSYLTTTWKITSIIPAKSLTTVTLDYKEVGNSLNVGMDVGDGLSNTKELYFFKDIGAVSEMETILDGITIGRGTWDSKTVSGGDYQSVQNFAVKMAVMKNKFSKEERTETNNGETLTYYVPVISEQDIHWYLPASSEQSSLSDAEYPLNGTYWSSTAANDNINAFIYDAATSTTSIGRMKNNKIRAVRQKP